MSPLSIKTGDKEASKNCFGLDLWVQNVSSTQSYSRCQVKSSLLINDGQKQMVTSYTLFLRRYVVHVDNVDFQYVR